VTLPSFWGDSSPPLIIPSPEEGRGGSFLLQAGEDPPPDRGGSSHPQRRIRPSPKEDKERGEERRASPKEGRVTGSMPVLPNKVRIYNTFLITSNSTVYIYFKVLNKIWDVHQESVGGMVFGII